MVFKVASALKLFFCLNILSEIVHTNVNVGRKISDVQPLFQALNIGTGRGG